NQQMLEIFHEINTFNLQDAGALWDLVPERLKGEKAQFDIVDGNKVLVEAGKPITARHIKLIREAGIKHLEVPDNYLYGRILARDIVDASSGELLAPANTEITEALLPKL